MTRQRKTVRVAVYLILGLSTAQAQRTKSITENSYDRARRVLDAGVQAAGGADNFRRLEDITLEFTSLVSDQGQSANPYSPYYVRKEQGTTVIDFRRNRHYRDMKTTYRGGDAYWGRQILKGNTGFTLDLISNVAYPIAPAAVAGNAQAMRRSLPHVLLQTALARASSIRWLGEDSEHKCRIITFADGDARQVALYFDAKTGLLTKYETLGSDPMQGDERFESVFSDYRHVAGLMLPFRVILKYGGEVLSDLTYADVKLNTYPADGVFDLPTGMTTGEETLGSLSPKVIQLAKDIYFVEGISGGDIWFYSQMFVVFNDYIALVEAPLDNGVSDAVMAKIREIAPGKPLQYLIPTHYHRDHIGGIRGYIAKDVTILTTPGNKRFIEAVASRPHQLRPDTLSLNKRLPRIETFSRKRVLRDVEHLVELYSIGPTPHVDEMILVYLPREKIAFVSDVLMTRRQGSFPPLNATNLHFAETIRKLGLDIETIANGHGWLGPMDDFRNFMEGASKQPSRFEP